jgi:hypothetical protein
MTYCPRFKPQAVLCGVWRGKEERGKKKGYFPARMPIAHASRNPATANSKKFTLLFNRYQLIRLCLRNREIAYTKNSDDKVEGIPEDLYPRTPGPRSW